MIADPGSERNEPTQCPVCSGYVHSWTRQLPGEIEGQSFDLFECGGCRLVFAWPLEVPDGLYDAIYRHGKKLGGYSRYVRYARRVARARDPLAYLARQEDIFWAVARLLSENPESRGWRMVDVGSGLGYLTASLRASGYDCVGIDISDIAVRQASESYGPWFHCQDIFALDHTLAGRFDVAILLETIEHVPDPLPFLRAVAQLIAPTGRIIISTPNRDAHPSGARWRTHLPPVHLYWFAERSVDQLALRAGYDAQLVNFTDFNARHQQTVAISDLEGMPAPQLDAGLECRRGLPPRTRVMELLRETPSLARMATAVYEATQHDRVRLVHRSSSIAALLTPRS